MGHIDLAVPVAHIWFFKTLPSPMGNLLDLTLRDLEKVIYYSNYVVIDPGTQDVRPNQLLDEDEYLNLRQKAREEGDAAFMADIGAPAVRELLRRIDVDKLAEELRLGIVRSRCSSDSRSSTRSARPAIRVRHATVPSG
jgi:DNA-directed RNA polymerase subunit beta'